MASVETFESTLTELVQAKRLSASKMSALTEIALKCMQNDTQLVSILYRTHKSLSTSSKVSSLYVFDALARAARHQVIKQGLTSDVNGAQGNPATFLLKMEGILDGLFQDMITSSHGEHKEKTKKILDIWVKSNTFPAAVLARLSKLLKGAAEKESDKAIATAPADPRNNHPTPSTPPQAPVPPPAAVTDPSSVQSTLLALLSQAANAVAATNGQTTPNTATPTAPVLDANQLSLFQQLTQAAKLGSGVPTQPLPVPVSLVPSSSSSASNAVPVVPPVGGPSQRSPNRDDHNGFGRIDFNHDRYGAPERDRDGDEYYDERRDFRGVRGGFRGGFRGRGRGGNYRDRPRDRDWVPPLRGRRSRSRSPPGRYGGRRDIKPYSPPRRPSVSQYQPRDTTPTTNVAEPPRAPDAVQDEFGRDVRAVSPPDGSETQPAAAQTLAADVSLPEPQSAPISTVDHESGALDTHSPPHGARPLTDPASAPAPVQQVKQDKGLDAFDTTTFDPSSAASWEALGNAWAVTHGYVPTETELMQFVVSGGLLAVASQFGTQQQQQQQQRDKNFWTTGEESTQYPVAAMRGRGGYNGYGNGRNATFTERTYAGNASYSGKGFGTEYEPGRWPGSGEDRSRDPQNGHAGEGQPAQSSIAQDPAGGGGASVGRMQRVGDKWVFVRNASSEVA